MENILLSGGVYLLFLVSTFSVLLLLRFLHLKFAHITSTKYLLVDSLILSVYIALLVYIDEHLLGIANSYCECQIDVTIYENIRNIFFFCSYAILGLYFFIKRYFLKYHPILTGFHGFIWELLIFTLGALSSGFLFVIMMFLLSGE